MNDILNFCCVLRQQGKKIATNEDLTIINNEIENLKNENFNALIALNNNVSITGTTPVSLGAITGVTHGKPIVCIVSLCASVNTQMGFVYLYIDGTNYNEEVDQFINFDNSSGTSFKVGLIRINNLPAGIHTFDVRCAGQGNATTVQIKGYNSARCAIFEV